MENIGAYEAKTHLSQLLKRVQNGERLTITKHGLPVAVLGPPDSTKKMDVKSVIIKLRQFRKKQSLKGISIKEMIEEGRR